MADIKVEIITRSDSITLYNEDIISLSTSTRSTSSPSTPTYGAFASDGTIVIRDENLALYKKAQQGFFDNYSYPVKIYLENEQSGEYEQIADQTINRRPEYSLVDKTLSISLSDKLSSADDLVYDGYAFPLEPKTAYDIFADLMQKFFGFTENEYYQFMQATAYANIVFWSIFQNVTIQYPYLPEQITYREAFASVLSLTHCALIIDNSGNPRLIYLDKHSNECIDEDIVTLPPDKTQTAFNTSIILDNKYDNAQVGATNVNISLATDIDNPLVVCENTTTEQGTVITDETIISQEYEISGQQTGTFKISGAKLLSYSLKKDDVGFTISQYADNGLKAILAINNLSVEDIVISCRNTITVYGSESTATLHIPIIGSISITYPNESTYSIVKETKTTGEDISLKNFIGAINFSGGLFNEGIEYVRTFQPNTTEYGYVAVDTNNNSDTINQNLAVNFNENEGNSTYSIADFVLRTGFHIRYLTSTSNSETEVDYARNNDPLYTYLYDCERTPISVTFNLKGVTRTINLENVSVMGEGSSNNIAEVSSYNKLLQMGRDVGTQIVSNEIGHFVDYYKNGIHTAEISVLGGVQYEAHNPLNRCFVCGDIVNVQNYDYESPMNYNSSDYATEMPIKWQVTENTISFDGGAIVQDMKLKELSFVLSGVVAYTNISLLRNPPNVFSRIYYTQSGTLITLSSDLTVKYSGYVEYTGTNQKLQEIGTLYSFEDVDPDITEELEYYDASEYDLSISFRNYSGRREVMLFVKDEYNNDITEDTRFVFTTVKVYYS